MVEHQAGAREAVVHHEGLDSYASNVFGGGYRPLVQLLGGSPQESRPPWRSETEEVQVGRLSCCGRSGRVFFFFF